MLCCNSCGSLTSSSRRRTATATATAAAHPPPAGAAPPAPPVPPHVPQELQALIKYIEINKASDLDWFTIRPTNKEGTRWEGKCWYIHDLLRYEFDFQVGAALRNAMPCHAAVPQTGLAVEACWVA
jgi:hypothetical protein